MKLPGGIKLVSAAFVVCFISVACGGRPSQGQASAVDSLSSVVDSDTVAPGEDLPLDFNAVLSMTWVEISREKEGWIIVPCCDAAIPAISIYHDTLVFNWGDGGVQYYKLDTGTKTVSDSGWALGAVELDRSELTSVGSPVTIFIKPLDYDKTEWRFGKDAPIFFVNSEMMPLYPTDTTACKGFDEEYKTEQK